MAITRYWSVEECRWVDPPAREDDPMGVVVEVPVQRQDEPAVEGADA